MTISAYTGEIAALATACFWTATALAFEAASKRLGSVVVNMLRLILAFIYLGIFSWITRGSFLPDGASLHNWLWLSLSGLIGFVFGDLFLFESYTIIGSRIAMLIMTLVPPLTALIGWIVMDEHLSFFNIVGMFITLAGIALVISQRKNGSNRKSTLAVKGLFFAFLGAVGQAVGLVLSKFGMGNYNAFSATQIRIITGIVGFTLVVSFFGKWKDIAKTLGSKNGMLPLVIGSVFGPFLGVSFSLYAVQHTQTGIASTLMALVPVFIIAPSVVIFKQKVSWKEILGAIISVMGVATFFI